MNKTTLSTQPYKGTSDTYPKDMLVRNYVFETWSRVAKLFGYEEYDTPMLEDANIYRVKSGDEIANTQLYNFIDKGGREVALRPEMTPSLARMIAAKRNELVTPIRWFNISKYYRYEKPQRGRSREFFQLNIDIFGVEEITADIEILQYTIAVMREFGVPKDKFELRISNRYLLDYVLDNLLGLGEEEKGIVAKAIDNYLKVCKDDFPNYLKDLGLEDGQIDTIIDYLNWDIEKLRSLSLESKGAKQLVEIFDSLDEDDKENIKFCPYIVRGFLYYTGIVFEMYDIGSKENPRAILGGGRYDSLLEIFGKEPISGVGLGWGDQIMIDFLRTYDLLPTFESGPKVFVTMMDTSLYKESSKTTQFLRENSIETIMQLSPSKLSKQLQFASKANIPWVIIIGEDELKEKKVLLKNMLDSSQEKLSLEEVLEKIQ